LHARITYGINSDRYIYTVYIYIRQSTYGTGESGAELRTIPDHRHYRALSYSGGIATHMPLGQGTTISPRPPTYRQIFTLACHDRCIPMSRSISCHSTAGQRRPHHPRRSPLPSPLTQHSRAMSSTAITPSIAGVHACVCSWQVPAPSPSLATVLTPSAARAPTRAASRAASRAVHPPSAPATSRAARLCASADAHAAVPHPHLLCLELVERVADHHHTERMWRQDRFWVKLHGGDG